jgi:hypothetical protein
MNGAAGRTTAPTLTMIANDVHDERITLLKQRAEALRRRATGVHELVGQAYRRRAAELELQAWLTQVRAGLVTDPMAA